MTEFFLTTKRLGLRFHNDTDREYMRDLNSDPEVIRYTGDPGFHSLDEVQVILDRLKEQYASRKMGRFVVLDRHMGEKLGWCGLKWHDDEGAADLGYRFFKKHWGKGYATESSRASIDYAFKTLKLPKLIAHAHPDNLASIHVLEKLGFKSTGPKKCQDIDAISFELLSGQQKYS